MTILGKIGRTHGKYGKVKIIPEMGKNDIFSPKRSGKTNLGSALVLSNDGEKCELENISEYTRGRFIGTLNGFRSESEVKRFKGGIVVSTNDFYKEDIRI